MNNVWQCIRKVRWNRQLTRNAKVPNLDEIENLLEKWSLRKSEECYKNFWNTSNLQSTLKTPVSDGFSEFDY